MGPVLSRLHLYKEAEDNPGRHWALGQCPGLALLPQDGQGERDERDKDRWREGKGREGGEEGGRAGQLWDSGTWAPELASEPQMGS